MSYSEDLKVFAKNHTYKSINAGGGTFRYVISGKKDGLALVLLNGGMNTLEMWQGYVDALSADYQVLLFDYPQELKTNQELVRGMHEFFKVLGITKPVFVGASDGGMVSQIYTQKYRGEVGGLILISTGGMDAATLKSLKKKYFLAPLMLFYMKHCNYEKLKPRLIKAGMGHIRNESEEQAAYAQDMFETIFKDYKREKDVHISGLLADLMNQTPVTEADFRELEGKILLILPNQDFFSGEMQQNLIKLMHNPEIKYVSGGHLSTVLKVDDYVQAIRGFLQKSLS
ncbi:MAG: alpha/beta hydrolase [Clostridia bacterium]|nr:alpha/beta hydrolase [[Bacteroides] pectinophilus]MDD5872302.1 alpha/beta hydrolase [Clostridia bacterium]